MKYSNYNHLVKVPDEQSWILYNFLSGAMIQLDEENKSIYEQILQDDAYASEKALLTENGFLVDYDELAFIRVANKRACADKKTLSLLIAPTMGCNFSCPYCFEYHRAGVRSKEVQDQIIQFISDSVKKNHHEHIFVYWFGGEPLLAADIIESMADRIMTIANSNGIQHTSAVVTNGYLLSEKILRMLEKHCVERIQVTLDGVGQINDASRMLHNGEGTFETIMENLSRRTTINIVVRSNISKRNMEHYGELYSYLVDFNKKYGTNLTLYPARMEVYHNSKTGKDEKLSQEEFFKYLGERGFLSTQKINDAKFVSCTAERFHSYAFDEKGNVYRCWNDVGNELMSFSTVDQLLRDNGNVKTRNIVPYLDNGYQFDDECLRCKLLPVCMGGCIMKRNFMKERTCTPIKFHTDDFVLRKFFKESDTSKGGEIHDADC